MGNRSHHGQKKCYKDALKTSLNDLTYQSPGIKLRNTERSRADSSEKELMIKKERESAKKIESANSGKPVITPPTKHF